MTPLAASSSLTHTQCAFVLRPCRQRPCLALNIANVNGQGTRSGPGHGAGSGSLPTRELIAALAPLVT